MVPVKREIDDPSDCPPPLSKRSKVSSSFRVRALNEPGPSSMTPLQYNPLDEPSPLGLQLRKSPSLLELIQMRLEKSKNGHKSGGKKELKGGPEKLKASNFPASLLRIGNWEYKSKYEGDLVAKCYFAKHKLVWEVLDGGLKNKIEIQWCDIVGLKATYPEDRPETLDVVLSRQPLFFRETNPQPRKHTLWQATSDFTDGQASIHRRHYLECPQGSMGKHFEKLIQCDPRLNFLSQQPDMTLDSPYFEPKISVFEDPDNANVRCDPNNEERSALFNLQDPTSPSGSQSSFSKNEQDLFGRTTESVARETPSPSSVMDTHAIEEFKVSRIEQLKGLGSWDQIMVPGLRPSMSMSDLVSHLESRISEQKMLGNPLLSSEEQQCLDILEDISKCLFSESQHIPAADEKSLMLRVNSLCCLLQKDPPTLQNLQFNNTCSNPGVPTVNKSSAESEYDDASTSRNGSGRKIEANSSLHDDHSKCKQISSMPRTDSVGELLLNLPRIASLPQFLFNITEDDDGNQAR